MLCRLVTLSACRIREAFVLIKVHNCITERIRQALLVSVAVVSLFEYGNTLI